MKKSRRVPPVQRLAVALPALFLLLCSLDRGLAGRWRDGFSMPAMRALHRLTAKLPFPLLEPLAVAAAGAAVCALVATAFRRLTGRAPDAPARWLQNALWAALAVAGALALLWAPACLTAPDADCPSPDARQLEALCEELIDALSASPPGAFPAGTALRRAPEIAGLPGCAVKAARWPEWMRAARICGLFMPLTGEAIVDADGVPQLVPFTAVHELMHLSGIADEGAANIAAWQRCQSAGGEFAASARLWALRYALDLLRRADESAWRRTRATMREPLREIYREAGGDAAPDVAGPLRGPGNYAALVGYLASAH